MKKVLQKTLLIAFLFVPIVEGICIINLYTKPRIVIKVVVEDTSFANLPILPKESLKVK